MEIEARTSQGRKYNLTQNSYFDVIKVTGLNPCPATISTANSLTRDGTIFTNSKLNQRNIVLTLALKKPIEESRWRMYEIFVNGENIRLYFILGWKTVYIDGYIETNEFCQYERGTRPTISIICPTPYFINSRSISKTFTNEERNIFNDGIQTGVKVTLKMTGTVTNPKVTNLSTGRTFTINGTFNAEDILTFNSNDGVKTLTYTTEGSTKNWLDQATEDSLKNWLYLKNGDNILKTNSANISATITTTVKYIGI